MKYRCRWLDVLKGFGIIFVVVGHFCDNDRIYHWIYSFHMPLFFFASGFLYHRQPIILTIKHKFMTLMVPYFIFGLISQLFYAINELSHAREVMSIDLLAGLLYGTYSSIIYNKVLWFLPVLFCISVIYNIVKNSEGGGQKRLYLFCAILTVVSIFNIMPETAPWGIDSGVCGYFVYYFLGNVTAEHNWIEKIRKNELRYGIISAFVLIGINFLLSGYGLSGGMSYVLAMTGVAGWVCVSVIMERYVGILEQVGRTSLCILCLHMPVCEIFTKIMVRVTNMTFEASQLELRYVVVRCAVTILICMICQYMIIKTAPWMLGKGRHISTVTTKI